MKAYELLSQEGKWAQGSYAKTQDGLMCDVNSPHAFSFCVIGAIERCYFKTEAIDIKYKVCNSMSLNRSMRALVAWNDFPARKQEEVVALLKELDI